MNKFLLTFTLLIGMFFQVNAATVTWTGATDNDWNTATNWDTGVLPVAGDVVLIPSGKTVDFTGTHTVQRVKISGSGTLNIVSGTLTILPAGASEEALEQTGSSATIVNDGTIFINNTGTSHEGVLCKGTWMNNGTLTINNTTEHNLRLGGGSFTNNGVLNITLNNGSTDEDGISVDDNTTSGGVTTLGNFVNTGTVNLTMTAGDEGVDITDASTLTNNGIFNITASGADMGVKVRKANSELINNGTLTITGTLDRAISIEEGGKVDNNGGGTIDCSNSSEHGIDVNNGTFNNAVGALYKAIATKDGIFVRTTGTVNNDGDMWLDLCTSEEIEIAPGSAANFINSATATFHPGSSPGDFEIKHDMDLGASTTTFEIGGLAPETDFDQYENFGGTGTTSNLTISSATAHLDWGNFVPAVDDCFKIIDGSGTVTGAFASITSSNAAIVFDTNPAGDKHDPATEVIICITALLPVELNSFEGKIDNAASYLSWQTQTEENNDYFEVQYSTDGREFSTIGMVQGNGTTSEIQNYDYTHKDVRSVDNYYRLKQVDFDGDFEYSDIIYLQNDRSDSPVAIFPNPARESLTYDGAAATLTFFDIQGRQVMQQVANERTTIDISTFKSGVYTIEILTNTGNRTIEKLIKE